MLYEKEKSFEEMTMRVCALQMDVIKGDRAANQAAVERLVAEAVKLCAPEVIVLPELWSTGYALERAFSLADERGDASFLGRLACEYGIAFAGGSVLAEDGGSLFNRAQVIDRDGRYAAHYDKTHLFGLMDEGRYLSSGRKTLSFEMGGLRCASVTCYDIRFCELPRRLAVEGAEVLFVSAEWPMPRVEHWRILLRARAIENQMFVAACNRGGVTDGEVFAGNSMLIAPDGTVLADAGTGEEIIWADFEPEQVRRTRSHIPVFMDRVPELY